MKNHVRCLVISLLLSSTLIAQERPTPFDPDSAASVLRTLSIDIGPRPMGSPGEQMAMTYAIGKFQEFGLDQAYVLPFRIAPSGREGGANTTSGTAVGVLRGKTDRIIVVGGHIDSYSPEGPGANDDGSGSAVVLELARVMAQREWESTIVFCLFGGEESGLKGSFHFVSAFDDLDKVALMLQVDMANGSDWLIPLLDIKGHSAPDWLVNASYEEFDKLGYDGLSYPTHFLTLNNLAGGASSDHEPFLRAGIPAIDFTTDIRDIIHSPQDSYENFILGGLERSGDLVYRLVERFDDGVPDDDSGLFMTMQIGRSVYLLPFWLLWTCIVGSIVIGVLAIRSTRPGRFEKRGEVRPTVPGLKVLLLTFISLFFLWLSEDIVSLLSGLRTPWYSNPDALLPLALVGGMIGVWISAILAPRMKLSNDLYRYLLRALSTLLVFVILFGLTGPRLAIYPATGLFFLSLAALTRRGWLAIALVVCGAYPTFRLLDSEVFGFTARMFGMIPPGSDIIITVILAIVSTLLAAPYGLALTGILRSKEYAWPTLPVKLTHPAIAAVLVVVWIIAAANIMTSPAYAGAWLQKIDVTQEASETGNDLSTTVKSNEYLDGTSITFMALDTVITGHETVAILPKLPFNTSTWLSSEVIPAEDGSGVLSTIRTWTRPYTVEVRYTTRGGEDRATIIDASAGLKAIYVTNGSAEAKFYSFPDTLLLLPVSLTLDRPDTVYQTIVATFVESAVPLTVTKENSLAIYRTIVQNSRSFFVSRTKTDQVAEK